MPTPETFPPRDSVLLPSRAFLFSVRDQTLPARRAAIEEARVHFDEARDSGDVGWRDMALLGVIAEAMQPFEDLAYLATAWDQPFAGLAHYVRATVYSGWTPTNFWQTAGRWPDDRLAVFAGMSARDPSTAVVVDILEGMGVAKQLTDEQREVLAAARKATLNRLRLMLGALAKDWKQYGPYFLAFKHGGLAAHREDLAWVADDVECVDETTPTHQPSVAIWRRGRTDPEGFGDFNLSSDEVVRQASSAGRHCVALVEAFAESRVRMFDALELDEAGEVVGFLPTHIPWTHWLLPADLTEDQWKVIGAGPRLTWVIDADG